MICREQLDNPNDDGRGSVTGGHDDPNPNWCFCRQGECEQSAEYQNDLLDAQHDDEERAERLYEEDEMLYGI